MSGRIQNWEWHEIDSKETERYFNEMIKANYCPSCQGYGQDWEKIGEDCAACHGTGKTPP